MGALFRKIRERALPDGFVPARRLLYGRTAADPNTGLKERVKANFARVATESTALAALFASVLLTASCLSCEKPPAHDAIDARGLLKLFL